MRADAALADRRKEVRDAARGWRRVGAIDDAILAAVEAAYPDDRKRLRPAFRALAFIFTIVALGAFSILFFLFWGSVTWSWVWFLLLGAGLGVLTEYQIGALRRCQAGTEEASALMAIVYLMVGSTSLFQDVLKARPGNEILLAFAVFYFAAAAWRWGFWIAGAISAVLFFGLLAHAPAGRLWWIPAALVLIPILVAGGDSARLAPAHRRSCQAILIVALVAFYLAVNVASWDRGVIEWITRLREPMRARDPLLRAASIAATALLPMAVLVYGIRTRRRIFLYLGLLFTIASLATLRFYFQVAPLWTVLIAGGLCAVGVALLVRRFLNAAPGKERGGFTAEPLFEDTTKQRPLEVAGAVLSLSPEARAIAPDSDKFTGGGGRSGGGGASGTF